MTKKRVEITTGLVQADYNFWVGKYMDKFYDGLKSKLIIGNKCPACDKVFVPPRKICGSCFKTIEFDTNWVKLKDTGILKNYTATTLAVYEAGKAKNPNPTLIGMIQFDGSDTAVIYPLLNLQENDLKIGMTLQTVWNEERKGHPKDIKGFTSLKGGES